MGWGDNEQPKPPPPPLLNGREKAEGKEREQKGKRKFWGDTRTNIKQCTLHAETKAQTDSESESERVRKMRVRKEIE